FGTHQPEAEIAEMVVVGRGDGEGDGHDLTADFPCTSKSYAPLRLDVVPDHRRNVWPAHVFDRPNAGGRCNVDFREIAVDHVDANEQQASLTQGGTDPLADFSFAFGQFSSRRYAPTNHIGSQIVGCR